ncbi:MAG TPA: hypothetical protein PKC67_13435 [Kiritimatiellia bacterium]|nr:hypothetical protein [Kiritimatiellia bacterium]HMP35338.1 hypothetical protein [Kiritimatiellia bacterium]
MKTWRLTVVVGSLLAFIMSGNPAEAVRLGIGANYWQTIDSVDVDDFDEDGLSWVASLQFELASYSKIELGVEWYEAGFGGAAKDLYAPQAFFILGKGLYAGIGIGGYYTDGEWADDPFYALRAGLDVEILPNISLDINANYRFQTWDDLSDDGKDVDTDTVILGAAIRFGF